MGKLNKINSATFGLGLLLFPLFCPASSAAKLEDDINLCAYKVGAFLGPFKAKCAPLTPGIAKWNIAECKRLVNDLDSWNHGCEILRCPAGGIGKDELALKCTQLRKDLSEYRSKKDEVKNNISAAEENEKKAQEQARNQKPSATPSEAQASTSPSSPNATTVEVTAPPAAKAPQIEKPAAERKPEPKQAPIASREKPSGDLKSTKTEIDEVEGMLDQLKNAKREEQVSYKKELEEKLNELKLHEKDLVSIEKRDKANADTNQKYNQDSEKIRKSSGGSERVDAVKENEKKRAAELAKNEKAFKEEQAAIQVASGDAARAHEEKVKSIEDKFENDYQKERAGGAGNKDKLKEIKREKDQALKEENERNEKVLKDANSSGQQDTENASSEKNSAGYSDRDCEASSKVLNADGTYRCSVTRGVIGSAQAVSQAANLAGTVSTQIAGGVAVGAAKSGSMAATYNAAGDAALGAAWSSWGVAAINTAMGGILSDRARGHANGKSDAAGIIKERQDKLAAAQRAYDTAPANQKADKLEERNKADAELIQAQRAFSEQEEHEGLANATSMGAYTSAATSIAQGIQQYATAQANYRSGCVKGVGASCDETPFGNPNYDGNSATEQTIVPDVVSNSDGATTDNISGMDAPDSAGDPNNPVGGGGGPMMGSMNSGGSGGGSAPGGGGGGLGGGGSTSVAKDESGEGAPSQANAGKQPFYANGSSGGYASGSKGASSGGSGKGGVGDLASMLAAAFGKKPGDEKDKSGSILDFDKNRAAENASLLSKETNFFARIHEAYQEKQRANAIGFVQVPARALASEPARKGGR